MLAKSGNPVIWPTWRRFQGAGPLDGPCSCKRFELEILSVVGAEHRHRVPTQDFCQAKTLAQAPPQPHIGIHSPSSLGAAGPQILAPETSCRWAEINEKTLVTP